MKNSSLFSRVRKTFAITLCILLLIIIGIFHLYKAGIRKTNAQLRSNSGEDDYTEVEIEKRDSDSSKWQSHIDNELINGAIYDMIVYNYYEGDIKNWSVRINILDTCYLNEAWSGDVEIHQFNNGTENVQRVNLERYSIEDINLDYSMADTDLAIILHKGDYIIYYASVEEEEDPITNKAGDSSCGFIFYGENDVDFSDITLRYNTYLKVNKSTGFYIFQYAMALWIFLFLLCVIVLVFMYINNQNNALRDRQIEESLGVFIGFIDAKDQYTNGHSTRVAKYATLLAKNLGYKEKECRDIYHISLMHDCGKCFIPDEILKKPDRLSKEEYEIMKQHTTKGAELLQNFKSLRGIADGAHYHHERYDGKGYPTGKKGNEIPRIARIISVVDAYDSMRTGRIYSQALGIGSIRDELVDGRGTQFDPEILDKFIQLFDEGELLEIDKIK